MTKLHHLESKLKALKLGGMLDTLELRLDQARKNRLGYVEFLELLLEDEVQRRANKSLAARIAKARFEEVSFDFNPKIPAPQIRDLATCQFVERKESVIICGPVGGRENPHSTGFRDPGVPPGLQGALHQDPPHAG
jgi:DNA replication protein DnaC